MNQDDMVKKALERVSDRGQSKVKEVVNSAFIEKGIIGKDDPSLNKDIDNNLGGGSKEDGNFIDGLESDDETQ